MFNNILLIHIYLFLKFSVIANLKQCWKLIGKDFVAQVHHPQPHPGSARRLLPWGKPLF
jgi:hypothetical protein